MKRVFLAFSSLLISSLALLFFPAFVHAFALHIPYDIVIEKINPDVDCLRLRPSSMSIEITNHCPQIFSLEGKTINNSDALHDNSMSFSDNAVFGIGKQKASYPVMWTLHGKLGTKDIIISGQTTYTEEQNEEQEWTETILGAAIILVPLSIFLTCIVILYKKKKLGFLTLFATIIFSYLIAPLLFFYLIWITTAIIPEKTPSPSSYSSQMQIAVNTITSQNKNDCVKIADNDLHQACLAMSSNTPSLCGRILENDTTDWCYLKIATIKKNPDTCQNINHPENRDSCYFQIAVETSSPSICQKINDTYSNSNPDRRTLCIDRIRRGW